MFFFPQNEINIIMSGLLPELDSGEVCFDWLGLIESLEGEACQYA